jgi:hypothetical protein
MTTLYIKNASQRTQPKDSQKYVGVVPIRMFEPTANNSEYIHLELTIVAWWSATL